MFSFSSLLNNLSLPSTSFSHRQKCYQSCKIIEYIHSFWIKKKKPKHFTASQKKQFWEEKKTHLLQGAKKNLLDNQIIFVRGLKSESEIKPIHTEFLSYAQKVWNLLTYSLGTEQEILISASLKSASMQERMQLFPLISTTIPTFPETLNCLFNRSLSSQNKHGNNYSCVFTFAVKHHIRVASVPQKPSWCFQWKFKNPLLSSRICLHLSAVALDTNVAWLQNKLLLFKTIHFSWPEIQQIMTIPFLMWLSIQFCWL